MWGKTLKKFIPTGTNSRTRKQSSEDGPISFDSKYFYSSRTDSQAGPSRNSNESLPSDSSDGNDDDFEGFTPPYPSTPLPLDLSQTFNTDRSMS